jgi:hypothetical protein
MQVRFALGMNSLVVGRLLKAFPQGLKPIAYFQMCGTAEAVPFQSEGGSASCEDVPFKLERFC